MEDFYANKTTVDGKQPQCKACHYRTMDTTRTRKRIQTQLKELHPEPELRLESNRLAIQLLALEFSRTRVAHLTHPVHIQGCVAPIKNGLRIEKGEVGPVLIFQTQTKRIKKSLAIEPVEAIAAEMALNQVQIMMRSLPMPPKGHKLYKTVTAFRRKASQIKKLGGVLPLELQEEALAGWRDGYLGEGEDNA